MNWTVNIWDLVLLIVGGVLIYARLVAVETKLDPMWQWWNRTHSLSSESVRREMK